MAAKEKSSPSAVMLAALYLEFSCFADSATLQNAKLLKGLLGVFILITVLPSSNPMNLCKKVVCVWYFLLL